MPEALNVNESRQAVATIRGYRYQILRTIYEWLELKPGQLLYIEKAEDFDRVSDAGADTFQVKDTAGSGCVTLRTTSVVDAINNYWRLKEANPRTEIRFHLVTTSPIGIEMGNPFGQDRPGLGVWENARSAREQLEGDRLTIEIRDFLLKEAKLTSPILAFLGAENASKVRKQLVEPIAWHASEPTGKEVEEAIIRKLQTICWDRKITTNYAEKILDRLERHSWTVASSHTDRALSIEDFYRHFDEATSVSIPQSGLDDLLRGASQAGTLGALALSGPREDIGQALTILGRATRLGSPPPLPESVMPRSSVADTLAGIISQHAVVDIQGSAGTGKTTQAAMLTQRLGNDWLWVSCRDTDEIQLRTALAEAGRWLDRDRTHGCIVLDDVDVHKQLGVLESILMGLLYTIRERKGALVVTSHHAFPQRLRLCLNLNENVCFSMPAFSEAEIGDYLLKLGLMDAPRRARLGNLILLRTRGHPQLVAAHAAHLRQIGFPEFALKDLLETPTEIREAQDEARLLLSKDLPVPQRDLLYRLSLLTGPFTRQRGLAVAGIATEISTPGDAFDQLVGPWLERVDASSYRISPLIQNAGQNANGGLWAKRMHGSIAGAWVGFKDQTPWGVTAILFHALIGGNCDAIARLSIGLYGADDEIWEALAAADAVFIYAYLDSGQTFPDANPFHVFSARLLQFRLAARNRPEVCTRILDRIEDEFPLDSKEVMVKIMRQMLLSQVVLHPKVPLSVRRVVATIEQLVQVADELPSDVDGREFRVKSTDEIFNTDGHFDVAPALGLALVQRIRSIEDLREAIAAIETIEPVLRNRCLRMFRVERDMGRQLSDTVWLSEHQSASPRWRELVDALGLLFSRSLEWREIELAASVASVRARTQDENLNDADGALESLSTALQQCGQSYLLLDAKARILSDCGKIQEALTIWKEILDVWEADEHANTAGVAQAFRRAAIAASKCNGWSEAASYFQRAAVALKDSENHLFAIGLYADSGYAHWRSGNADQSVEQLVHALSGLASVPNSPDDLQSYYLHKVIGHVMTWMAADAMHRTQRVDEPFPGCCSHLDPKDEVANLHVTPIDFSWSGLVTLAQSANIARPEIEENLAYLRKSPYPVIRMRIAEHQIAQSIEKARVSELVARIADLVEGLISTRKQDDSCTVLLMAICPHVRFAAARTLWKMSSDGASQAKAHGGDRPGDVALHRTQPHAGGSLRVGQAL